MSLPIIVEVAIGLIFVYLTLSLVASEIQELLTNLLQWRADHFKRSIEVLLSGNSSGDRERAITLANTLYQSPPIQALNQEATGLWSNLFREINHVIGRGYRAITRTRNVFGDATSGPSKIPIPTLANTLLGNLQLETIHTLVTDSRLRRFVEERLLLPVNHMVNDLRASTANEFLLSGELRQLEQSLGQLLQDFQDRRATLAETLDRLLDRLDEFAVLTQSALPEQHHLTDTFLRRLRFLRQTVAHGDLDKTALLRRLQPNLQELVTALDAASPLRRELATLASREGGMAQAVLERLEGQPVPESLRQNLGELANRVEGRIADLSTDLGKLQQATETWFDQGMERAKGVYQRNAKGVAFAIGMIVAIGLNADSFHMVDRFATDPILREAIAQSAQEVAEQYPEGAATEEELAAFRESVRAIQESAQEKVALPFGYTETVLTQQRQAEATWNFFLPRRLCGWLITGIAVSMGSKFWFDLLKKLVNVRSGGGNTTEGRSQESV